ncbi:hypothetical protein [Streptomyces clavuligerus]|uniref:hypothetical protein n=1 Tax=Streptomyces clavuligerus TaxID=1901 RepID=UPI0001851797|nr:hypothetical protein [Streptomyces clavuligerus]WDN56108.1 hypothetical protein LL058_30050 [Streptomyces clavuligerus]
MTTQGTSATRTVSPPGSGPQTHDAERVRGQSANRAEAEEDLRLQPRLLLMPGGRDGQHALVGGQERGEGLVQPAGAAAPVGRTGHGLR